MFQIKKIKAAISRSKEQFTLDVLMTFCFLAACSPMKDSSSLINGSFSEKIKSSGALVGSKYSYKPKLPIFLNKTDRLELTDFSIKHLKKSLDDQWVNADVLSENSFKQFLDRNQDSISLYQIDMNLSRKTSTKFTLEQAVDELGILQVPPLKNKILMNVYKFKVNVKWHLKVTEKERRKLYLTPLKDELILAEFISLDNRPFNSNDIAEFLINYSKFYSRTKWKSNLVASLMTKYASGPQIAIISGEGLTSSHPDAKLVAESIGRDIFTSACKLYYFETRQADLIKSCNFEESSTEIFNELASLDKTTNSSGSFLNLVERDLGRLTISGCKPDEVTQINGDKQLFDVYVKVSLKDESVKPLVSKGRKINLYQKKGRKKAYRLKRHAVVESFVDPALCELESDNLRCLKAKYLAKKTKVAADKRCQSIVSGKFFFSVRKDSSIFI